jgi:hypothetical protein
MDDVASADFITARPAYFPRCKDGESKDRKSNLLISFQQNH